MCIDALSVNINKQTLEAGNRNVRKLNDVITQYDLPLNHTENNRIKATDAEKLKMEYKKLVEGDYCALIFINIYIQGLAQSAAAGPNVPPADQYRADPGSCGEMWI